MVALVSPIADDAELTTVADLMDAVAQAIRDTGKGGIGKVPAAYLDGWSARIRAVASRIAQASAVTTTSEG